MRTDVTGLAPSRNFSDHPRPVRQEAGDRDSAMGGWWKRPIRGATFDGEDEEVRDWARLVKKIVKAKLEELRKTRS